MIKIIYKTALAEYKPFPSKDKDSYLELLSSNKRGLYTGEMGIYISRQVDMDGQKLYFPFIDIDSDQGLNGDDAIESAIVNAALTLGILRKMQADNYFTLIASGGTGLRLSSTMLLDYDTYQAFTELVQSDMPHIHDLQPTDHLTMPHQLLAYKGNPAQNTKTLIDRHSEIFPASLIFNNEMTVARYKELTAGKIDPYSAIESTEKLLSFKPITDLSVLGELGKKLTEYKEIGKEQLQDIYRISGFRGQSQTLSLEVLCERMKEKGIRCKTERRGLRDALSFANLPCPLCGKTSANARAYPPSYMLKCFNSNCAAYNGIPLREWAGITQPKHIRHVQKPPEPSFDTLPEACQKILAELDSPDSSLILATPGTGKTHITLEHFVKQKDQKLVIYSCLNRQLKQEAYDKAKRMTDSPEYIYMLQSKDELCKKPKELNDIVGKGYSPGEILCPSCEQRKQCLYYEQRKEIKGKGIYFVTHQMLQYISNLIQSPDVIVLDENILSGFKSEDTCSQDRMLTLGIVLEGTDFNLINRLLSISRGIAISHMRANSGHPVIVPARKMGMNRNSLISILSRHTKRSESEIKDTVESIIKKISAYAPLKLYETGVDMKAVLWLKGFLKTYIYSYLFISKEGAISFGIKHLCKIGYDGIPVKLLDATGDENVARAITGRDIKTIQSDVPWKSESTHIKVSVNRKLIEKAKDRDIRKLLELAIHKIDAKKIMINTYLSQKERVLRICNEIDPSKQYQAYHFHGPRGVNEFEACDAVIVLGLPYPNLGSTDHDACILFPDEKDIDKRDTWAESTMLWELVQGIHRIRPVRKDKVAMVIIAKQWPNIFPDPDNVIDLSHDGDKINNAIERLTPLVREVGFLTPDIGYLCNVIVKGKETVAAKIRDPLSLLLNDYEKGIKTYLSSDYWNGMEEIDGTINKSELMRKLIFDIYNPYIINLLKNDLLKKTHSHNNLFKSNPITLSNTSQWSEIINFFKNQCGHYETFDLKMNHCRGNRVKGIGDRKQVSQFYDGLCQLGIINNAHMESYRVIEERTISLNAIPDSIIVAYFDENNHNRVLIGHDGNIMDLALSKKNANYDFIKLITKSVASGNTTIITNKGKELAKIFMTAGIGKQNMYDIMLAEKIIQNGEDIAKDINMDYLFRHYNLPTQPDMSMMLSQLYQIWQEQQKMIDALKLKMVIELEMKVLWIIAKQELQGIEIDIDRMLARYYEADDNAHIKKEIDNFLPFIADNNRYHDEINQLGTITGRFSSRLHTMSRELRKLFIPKKGCVYIKNDYNQFEPRILAKLSGDHALNKIFETGKDLYSEVARIMAEDNITMDRNMAKDIVLGIHYGRSAYSIYDQLKWNCTISLESVENIMSRYKKAFSGIFDYREQTVSDAREQGYLATALGRRMKVTDDTKTTTLYNFPMQATAADILKAALVAIDVALESMEARIVYSLHDEIIVAANQDREDNVARIVQECMKAGIFINDEQKAVKKLGQAIF